MEAKITRWVLILAALLALTIAVAVISMALGPANIGPDQIVLIILSKIPFIGHLYHSDVEPRQREHRPHDPSATRTFGLTGRGVAGPGRRHHPGRLQEPHGRPVHPGHLLGRRARRIGGHSNRRRLVPARDNVQGLSSARSSGLSWSLTSPAATTAFRWRHCCWRASRSRPSFRRVRTS